MHPVHVLRHNAIITHLIDGSIVKTFFFKYISSYFIVILFFFGHTCGMWKFLAQGSNLCHGSDPNHSSDSTGS